MFSLFYKQSNINSRWKTFLKYLTYFFGLNWNCSIVKEGSSELVLLLYKINSLIQKLTN